MAEHNDLGRWGEELAAHYLQQKGYIILERNWLVGHKDLDLVALDADTLVFVEVKTRRNRLFADPIDAVGYQKVRHLQQAADQYLKQHRSYGDVRFDLITIVGTMGDVPEITHIEDAF